MTVDPAKFVAASLRLYQTAEHRVGLRSGLSDAAHICDALAKEIAPEGKRASLMKREIAEALKAAGDTIWRARAAVDVPGNGGRIIAGLQDACAYAKGDDRQAAPP